MTCAMSSLSTGSGIAVMSTARVNYLSGSSTKWPKLRPGRWLLIETSLLRRPSRCTQSPCWRTANSMTR